MPILLPADLVWLRFHTESHSLAGKGCRWRERKIWRVALNLKRILLGLLVTDHAACFVDTVPTTCPRIPIRK